MITVRMLLAATVLLGAPVAGLADSDAHEMHEAMERLMKEQNKLYKVLRKGILKGNFDGLGEKVDRVVELARELEQLEPPVHKQRIRGFRVLARELGRRGVQLKASLGEGDSASVKTAFQSLENACIDCHKAFRPD